MGLDPTAPGRHHPSKFPTFGVPSTCGFQISLEMDVALGDQSPLAGKKRDYLDWQLT